jgi:hypothetical protein
MTRSRCRTTLVAFFAALVCSALLSASAFASGKPFVETKPASAVTQKASTLNGIVNPNGAETKYYFQYGITLFYGSKTAEASAGAGTSNVEVSKAIAGLTELTSYHFRLVATNSNGTTFGADQVFSTTATPGLPEFGHTNLKYTLAGGFATFENNQRESLSCSASTGEGEITGAKTATGKLKLTGCAINGTRCQTQGAMAGEIVTGTLPVELVYISKERHEAGLVFNFQSSTFASWSCGITNGFGMRLSVIALVTPVNSNVATHTVTLAKTANIGEQNPTKYENGEGQLITAWPEMAVLNSEHYFQGDLTEQYTLTTAEPVNINA